MAVEHIHTVRLIIALEYVSQEQVLRLLCSQIIKIYEIPNALFVGTKEQKS